jgi:hypothetical protein
MSFLAKPICRLRRLLVRHELQREGCLIAAGGHYRTLMRGKTVSGSIGR